MWSTIRWKQVAQMKEFRIAVRNIWIKDNINKCYVYRI